MSVKEKMERLKAIMEGTIEPEDDWEKESLADDLFITDEGRPNWENIGKAREFFNIDVGPGEKDSFGWLTAYCVINDKEDTMFYFG